MAEAKKQKKSPGRPRKGGKKKQAANKTDKREDNIVTTQVRCPNCGEDTSILCVQTWFGGKKRYLCYSETCKNSGKRIGKGRYFILMPDGSRPKGARSPAYEV